jgi:hypothetical protein
MGSNYISKQWRKTLVSKLQERYGLTEEEAIQKTEAWLQWLKKQPSQQPQTLTADAVDQHPSSRQSALMGPGRSRSRSAGRT